MVRANTRRWLNPTDRLDLEKYISSRPCCNRVVYSTSFDGETVSIGYKQVIDGRQWGTYGTIGRRSNLAGGDWRLVVAAMLREIKNDVRESARSMRHAAKPPH